MTNITNVKQLKLNIMTQAQYDTITPSPSELYMITDAEVVPVDDAISSTSENPVQNKVIYTALNGKQDTLVSGTNIKTVNNSSLLGNGNITIDSLPSQSGQSGKFLTTNGTVASWGAVTVPTKISDLTDDSATYPIDKADTLTGLTATVAELNYTDGVTGNIQTQLNGKQDTLVSGTNIKTVNSTTLLGSGNIDVQPTIDSNNKLSSDLVDDTNHTHKFATSAQLTQIGTNQSNISTINGKIPSQASTTNQLADKAFVNSSVQTATANFRGSWSTWANVPTSASGYPADYAGSTTPTVNDYLVVQDASDYTGETLEGTWRFKYTGTWSTDGKAGWNPEYQVNETPLTTEQLAALNSGITSSDVALIGTALQPNDNISELTNDSGYITGITSSDVATALGYTPYNATNPDGYISGITSSDVTTALGYTPYNATNPSGYISGITSSDVTTALGYTPQAELISGTNIKTVNNNSLLGNGNITIDSLPSQSGQSGKFLTTNGTTASWSTITTPTVDQTFDGTSTNAQSGIAIAGELANYVKGQNGNTSYTNTGTETTMGYTDTSAGELYGVVAGKNTYYGTGVILGAQDSNGGYLTNLSTNGFTITNADNYPTLQNAVLTVSNNNLAVNGSEVATQQWTTTQASALATDLQTWVGNQGYITSAALSTLTDVALSNPTQGQNLTYDATLGKWKNTSTTATVAWGGITGTLAEQTDLSTALGGKQATLVSGTNIKTINDTSLLGSGNISVLQNTATGQNALAIEGGASGGGALAIGNGASASGITSTALGFDASASALSAIQIGHGTNSTAKTLNVGFYGQSTPDYNWQLLDGTTGLIPDARISTNIARTSQIPSVTVDQTFDGTSTNAQSGVAIEGKLGNYVNSVRQTQNGYTAVVNSGSKIDLIYEDNYHFSELYLDANWAQLRYDDYKLVVNANGFELLDADNSTTLTIPNGNLAVNGSEVALKTDIPTVPTNVSAFTNDAGYLTSIPSGYVQNTATATNSLTILGTTNNQNNSILIGYSTTTSSTNSTVIGNTAVSGGSYATALGYYARANGQYTTAIGNSSYANYQDVTAVGHNSQATAAGTLAVGSGAKATAQRATSIGYSSQATQYQATALGYEAKATANSALQIGTGTNNTANTLQVSSYTLLDTSTGLIPDGRISTNIARTSAIPDVSNFVTNSSLATTLSDYVLSSDLSTTLTDYVTNSALTTTLADYATQQWAQQQASSLYASMQTWVQNQGYITGITSSDVTTALTYTPADTDLSNLSVTGESKFQAPLVSGTNIKTINGTSILGGGNIDTSEVFVAEYGTTSYADVLAAYNDNKTILVNHFQYKGILYGENDNKFWFSLIANVSGNPYVVIHSLDANGWQEYFSTKIVESDLSNVSSIDSSSAVATALDKKVNTSDIWYDSTTSTLYIGVAQS